jgi:predicted ATP-grasp superfamily ATP-dependent carboligase
MDKKYKGLSVLLLDGYGRHIPPMLTQLHDLGCVITPVNDSRLDVGYVSRYPKRKILIEGIREDAVLLLPFLRKEIALHNFDVIIPVLEHDTELLLDMQERGETGDVKIVCAPKSAFEKAYDKQATMEVCMKNGIPCPITKMDEESLDSYLEKVNFPLACKPRKGSGAAGFKIAKSKAHLLQLINEGLKVEEYVIQEYIPHTDYHYGVYLMFDRNSRPISSVLVQSCRQFPVDGGPGCYIRTINNPEIRLSAEKLLASLGWSGMGHVGLIMDPRDNKAKVMEINGRIAAGIKICNCVGIQTVRDMLDFAHGVEMKREDSSIQEGVALRHFQADFMWLLKSPERFRSKPSWFDFRHNNDYVFSWRDPLPFLSYSIEHILSYRKDMKKRNH